MMDYEAIVVQVLALLQHETGEQCCWGIAEAPSEGISR
jgi:hypothetical protein